jgi:protease I
MMARIVVFVDDLYDEDAYAFLAEAYEANGHDIIPAGPESDTVITGNRHGAKLRVKRRLVDLPRESFEAVVLLGGASWRLGPDQALKAFLKGCFKEGKPIFAVGKSLGLLAGADVLRGRRVAGVREAIGDVVQAGGRAVDQAVVIDRNLITGRALEDLPLFLQASLAKLKLLNVSLWV